MNSSTGAYEKGGASIENQLEAFARASVSQVSKKNQEVAIQSNQVNLRGSYKISDRVRNQSSLGSINDSTAKGHNITFY